ncbi:MAG: precorrin-6y C5,15-methyltransferase (decarboxylating) subunit CbiE [Alphaproteobacteria bacterium]|nr:precorrin-6y C5,15-methyltransferase (decarboxylating) subunit CbiE [Alphaproteobacteria bacterium]
MARSGGTARRQWFGSGGSQCWCCGGARDAMTRPWLSVVGIALEGWDGLSAPARAALRNAELIIGGARHLGMVEIPDGAATYGWETPLSKTVARIRAAQGRSVVVLATGDPMHFGIGVTLARHFSPAEMTVWPQVSAFSLAAARLGWGLAECHLITAHGRPVARVRRYLQDGARLVILSEDRSTPLAVAELLVAAGCGASRMTVLAEMRQSGGESLRLELSAAEAVTALPQQAIPDLHCLAVECRRSSGRNLSVAAGLDDDEFDSPTPQQLLTKQPIRAMVLALLAPQAGDCLWDIGAGSGSVGIEFLRLLLTSSGGGHGLLAARAYAIERNLDRLPTIAANAERLGVPELKIVGGDAEPIIDTLPDPTVIFVGGGIRIPNLVNRLWQRLPPGGRMVATAVTLTGEARLGQCQEEFGGDLYRVAVNRSESIGNQAKIWRPYLPVTLWRASKSNASELSSFLNP